MIDLKNKNVVVFGMGVSGISALRLVKTLGAHPFAINSGEVSTWAKTGGVLDIINLDQCSSENLESEKTKKFIEACDLLILSPGIPRDHKILEPIHQKKMTIWGEIELGFQVLNSLNELKPIVAITGTNGKTTTTTFIGEMIEHANLRPFVGGNIGTPFCDMAYEVLLKKCKYDVIVLELSSFQLESIVEFRPQIALILNIFQNHGERYEKIEDYAFAKFNIVNNMTPEDVLIYPTDYKIIDSWAKNLLVKKISFDSRDFKSTFDLSKFKLPGHHNIVNLNFVTIVGELLKLKKVDIQKTIDDFRGVHFRIEPIFDAHEFMAFNDAKSTNWDATVTATEAMKDINGDLYLIIGGKKRGHGDSILPYLNDLGKRVKKFFLIGEMSSEIESELKDTKFEYVNSQNLEETIRIIRNQNFRGIVLFSPAFPSFDQYANYVQRGEHFTKLVTKKTI
jgi:UDP-N-acetylmuramoylalanine--D-glutamate ligase